MAVSVTLEQVEELAEQLPLVQQLKLVAHMTERASATVVSVVPMEGATHGPGREDRQKLAEELFAELDAIADSIDGSFDSAADVRAAREERANTL